MPLRAMTCENQNLGRSSVKAHQREPIFKATVKTTGEKFDLEKHPQGTRGQSDHAIRAMQIHEKRRGEDRCDLYVIVDI